MSDDDRTMVTTLAEVHVTYGLDAQGRPVYNTRWEDGATDRHGGMVTILGMLRMAEDLVLNAGFGREGDE